MSASPVPTAATLAIGDELLEGRHPDLNSAVIAQRLLELGVATDSMTVARDDEDELVATLEALVKRHRLVVTTGGLGPTLDDVTRHAVARAAGRRLVRDEGALRRLADWFARAGVPMAASNERQALLPEGAELLENDVGTAPGFLVEVGGALVASLPGPPREMRHVLENVLVPRLVAQGLVDDAVARGELFLFGLGESAFADAVGAWMDRSANPLIGVSADAGVLHVRLAARGASAAEAAATLAARRQELLGRLGGHVFSESERALEQVVGRRLIDAGLSVALAESCTTGLAAALLGRVPGISACLEAAFVAYSNRAKVALLGVDARLIERHGAVSAEVARAMAAGAAERAGARLAVAVTGIAGPDGGTDEKPVGLVWFGTSVDGRLDAVERRFARLGRERIRRAAAYTALDLLGRAAARVAPGR